MDKPCKYDRPRNPSKRSPLKAKPLRNPGQSLDEEIQRITQEEMIVWLTVSIIVLMMALLEWWKSIRDLPPNPWVFSFVAVAFWGIGTWKIRRAWVRRRALILGRDGERAVGQFLDLLREQGYRVFHDVVGEGFNVDHVAVGRTGVFSIETKTLSKPAGKNATITFDGYQISVGGFTLDRDPVVQAKAQAAWLRGVLKESTGRSFYVRPVILFPGWYIERSGNSEVWVLNPKALPAFLEKQSPILSEEDKTLAAYHLSRYLRTTPPPA